MAKGKTVTAFVKLAGMLDPSFEKAFNTAKSNMSELDKKWESAATSMQNLGNGMVKTGKKLTRNVTVPIVAAGAASVSLAKDYETNFAKVTTIVEANGDKTAGSMEKLKSEILKASSETGIAATELAQNTYDAISAGQKAGDAVKAATDASKLAKAGFAEQGAALDVLTSIQNAYGKETVGDFQKISDVLLTTQNLGKTTVGELSGSIGKVIPTANAFKVSLEDVGASYATLTARGVKTRVATTYVNSMFNELGKSSSNVSKILKQETGKSFKELMESGESVGDVLQTLQGYAEKTGTQFSDLWSNANASKAAETIKNAGADYNKTLKQMQNSSGATAKAAATMAETTEAKMKKLKNSLMNIGISMGTTLLDVFGPTIEKVSGFVTKLSEKFQGLSDGQKEMIIKFAAVAAAAGPLLTIGGKLFIGAGKLIKTFQTFKALTTGFQLAGRVAKLATGAGKLIGLIAGANPVVLGVVAAVAALVAIGVALYKNWDTIKAKASQLKEWVVTKWTELKTKTSETFGQIPSIISQKMEQAKAWAVAKLNAIKNFFSTILSVIVKLVIIRFVIIPNIIREKLASAASAARGALQNVKQVFVNKLTEIATWVAQKLAQIRNAFAHPITATINIAKNIKEKISSSKVDGKAKGGFTRGVTIAGEDPRYPVEAVLSFNPRYRKENIAYWARAGKMLGASASDMSNTGPRSYSELSGMDSFTLKGGRGLTPELSGGGGNIHNRSSVNMGGITFSPTINVETKTGEKLDENKLMKILRDLGPEFIDYVLRELEAREEGSYVTAGAGLY